MREKMLCSVIYTVFALLILGLVYTQIVRFGYYSGLSKNNSIRILPIDGPRGKIFDRNGELLVTNRLSFDIAVIYRELKNKEELIRLLTDSLAIPPQRIRMALKGASLRPYAPVTVVEDVDKNKAIALEEASFNMRGLLVNTRSKRHYLYDNTASHVFGYLSEITERELENLDEYGYRRGSLVGRAGLELRYDRYLAGSDGGMQVEVDNRGAQTRVLGVKEPSSGKDLYLALDLRLQKTCDRLLGGRKGAVIVMDPKNGEILALASHPSFDPNIFVMPGSSAERTSLLRDLKSHPLVNRAISGLYPPGSVFKIVVACAALETGRITNGTAFSCDGSYRLGRAVFSCWKESGHGSQDLKVGLTNSCNVFFYNTGRAAGPDAIEAFAKLFGYGRRTGIDLPDEAKGLVPGRLWKRINVKDGWYEGDTLNYAIGQGYLLVTPIQVLEMISVIANNGYAARPRIVTRIGPDVVADQKRRHNIGISKGVLRSVREGLFSVVNSEHGTGRRARIEGAAIAGKTGTAQNPAGATHAWFSGFAPCDDPRICLVVFVEHGGKGGIESADIAKGIFEEAKKAGYI
jgi:penicillin-binding protein 2